MVSLIALLAMPLLGDPLVRFVGRRERTVPAHPTAPAGLPSPGDIERQVRIPKPEQLSNASRRRQDTFGSLVEHYLWDSTLLQSP